MDWLDKAEEDELLVSDVSEVPQEKALSQESFVEVLPEKAADEVKIFTIS